MLIQRCTRLAVLLLLACSAAATGLSTPVSASESRPIPLACVTAMDSPHYSSGAGGAISKFRFCDYDGANANVDLILFLCPRRPSGSEGDWARIYGCVPKATASYQWFAQAQVQYTRYVPPVGQPGAHGTGWWVSCAVVHAPFIGTIPSTPQYFAA